jgi:CubicO group peptidase (beta-lactamase class C family)
MTSHFGFQWWLLPLEGLLGIMPQENDIYMAGGKYGQFIFAVPSLDMVVVISSDNEETSEFLMGIFSILYDHVLQAVKMD